MNEDWQQSHRQTTRMRGHFPANFSIYLIYHFLALTLVWSVLDFIKRVRVYCMSDAGLGTAPGCVLSLMLLALNLQQPLHFRQL